MTDKIKIFPNVLRSRLVKIDWRWFDLANTMGVGLRTVHSWNKYGWPPGKLDLALSLIEDREWVRRIMKK